MGLSTAFTVYGSAEENSYSSIKEVGQTREIFNYLLQQLNSNLGITRIENSTALLFAEACNLSNILGS